MDERGTEQEKAGEKKFLIERIAKVRLELC
jgi:hypothetical protein